MRVERVRDGRKKQKQRHAAVTVTLSVEVISGMNALVEKVGASFSELVDDILRQYLVKQSILKGGKENA